MTPKRIQRSRRKGYRLPPDAIYVGRPSRWGSPFPIRVGAYTAEASLRLFRMYAEDGRRGADWLEPLRGHDLACWCDLAAPCHADVLLELANQ